MTERVTSQWCGFGFGPEQKVQRQRRGPGRPSTIYVEHEGRRITLRDLSLVVDVEYEALRKRHRLGLRGDALIGSRNVGRPPKDGNWAWSV